MTATATRPNVILTSRISTASATPTVRPTTPRARPGFLSALLRALAAAAV